MRKKVVGYAVLIALVFLAGAGVTLALLQSQTEQRANVFASGEVDAVLTEPSWDAEQENRVIRPGGRYPKDPAVTNTGSTDAYLYLEVHIPKAEVRLVSRGSDGEDVIGEMKNTILFSYEIKEPLETEDGWIDLSEYLSVKETDDYAIRLYGYSRTVASGEMTINLFDEVAAANILEGDIPEGVQLDMPLYTYAIQSGYLGESGDSIKEKLASAYTIYQAAAEE